MITYLKLGAILALIAVLFGAGYHVGGMASKTTLEGFQAAQAELTAKAVLAERASAATELARVTALLKGYQDAPIDPAISTVATRLLYHACPANGPMSGSSAHPGTIAVSSGIPDSNSEIERATQDAFDAAARDAARLNLCRSVWPR